MSETILKKTCNKCKLTLGVDLFHKDRTRPDGLGARCKSCSNKISLKQYHDNVEHWNEYHKHKYSLNPWPSKEAASKLRNSIEPGVYMIKNMVTGECYIGQSIKPYRRRTEHLSVYNGEKSVSYTKRLQNDIKQLGKKAFLFGIIEHCNKQELADKERYYINLYKPQYNTNATR